MRWSIALPEPRSRHVPAAQELAACARAVEEAGYDGVWVTDHPFPLIERGSPGHHAWDPFASLAYVAGATERVLLHTNLVVLPYRNPFHVAKSAATVQHLSGGRLALTLGTGYLKPEFAALGMPFDGRDEAMRSGVEAMRAAWSGEPVHLAGRGWAAEGNTMLPAAPPHVLLRGGNSRAAIAHAAQAFDAWSPFEVAPEWADKTHTAPLHAGEGLAEGIVALAEAAAAAGRERPDVWLVRPIPTWLERPREEVRDELARLEELGVSWIACALGTLGSQKLDDLQRELERLTSFVR